MNWELLSWKTDDTLFPIALKQRNATSKNKQGVVEKLSANRVSSIHNDYLLQQRTGRGTDANIWSSRRCNNYRHFPKKSPTLDLQKLYTAKPLNNVETRIVPDVSNRGQAQGALLLANTLCLPFCCAPQLFLRTKAMLFRLLRKLQTRIIVTTEFYLCLSRRDQKVCENYVYLSPFFSRLQDEVVNCPQKISNLILTLTLNPSGGGLHKA